MSKIGFFGGCFNPPTNIHINIANSLIKEGKVEKVIFIPVNDYYIKKELIEAKHRYNMLKLITKNQNNLEVNDIEIKENRNLFAIDAFKLIEKNHLEKTFGKDEIFMIMGSDNFNKMPKWKDYDIIKNKYNFLIIQRNEKDITSTQIRNMIKNKDENVKKYIPKDVYQYIIKNNLYK